MMARYDPRANKSSPVLSKYERSIILGLRIEQLARGAQPFVALDDGEDHAPGYVADRELNERKLPYIVKRPMPNGTFEYWRIEDMIVY